jgi:hypothetical protein
MRPVAVLVVTGRAARTANLIRTRSRQTATLRRQNNLLKAPVLASSVSAGQTTASIKAASGALTGRVVLGSRFGITGITGTYTVAEDAKASASGVLAIAFTPAIPAGQSALTGAAVAFTQAYSDYAYSALNRSASVEDKEATEKGVAVRLLPYTTGHPAPEQNDLLDGMSIERVGTVDADDGIAFFRCFVADGSVRP